MHAEAYDWAKRWAPPGWPGAVLDIGGRNINGTVRDLFPDAILYRVIDIAPGEGVDVVADAGDWTPDRQYQVVVCCEVFEHTPRWRDICATAYAALAPGGLFIVTTAGPGRPPHSAIDGGWRLHPGEHYANIEPDDLAHTLKVTGFTDVVVDQLRADVRAAAYRPQAS